METKEEYRTRDMALSAALMVESVRYLRVEKDEENSRRLVFIFEAHPEIERIVSQRANGTHVVSSTDYDDKLRRMKTIVHGVQC